MKRTASNMGEIVTGINKEVWIPAAEKKIAEWEDFANSIFCETEEEKESAMDFANEFKAFLTALESDTVTRRQFEHIVFLSW